MTAGELVQRSFASMAAGAPDGSTFTIVLADGPCEIGEMAPRERKLSD